MCSVWYRYPFTGRIKKWQCGVPAGDRLVMGGAHLGDVMDKEEFRKMITDCGGCQVFTRTPTIPLF
jgi:hypothetical protein